MIKSENKNHELISTMLAPYILAAVVFAYFVSPLVVFLDPGRFAICGAVLAFSVILVRGAGGSSKKEAIGRLVGGSVLVTVALVLLGAEITSALKPVEQWRHQCAALQRDMGLLRPHRSNSAELFEALRCAPQAVGKIQFR